MSELTDKLGFYFLIFQRASVNSTLLRCYMDGNDKAVYYKDQELLDFCNQAGFDKDVEMRMKDCLDTTSIYLWDVEGRVIKRLSPGYNFENLKLELLKKTRAGKIDDVDTREDDLTNVKDNPYLDYKKTGEIKIEI